MRRRRWTFVGKFTKQPIYLQMSPQNSDVISRELLSFLGEIIKEILQIPKSSMFTDDSEPFAVSQ